MSGLWAAIAGIVSGILGGMGMGGGGVLILVLTLLCNYNQELAQGINLIFFLPCAVVAVIIYSCKNLIRWRIALPFALLGVVGALLGAWTGHFISGEILSKLFGGLLFFIGLKQLFQH